MKYLLPSLIVAFAAAALGVSAAPVLRNPQPISPGSGVFLGPLRADFNGDGHDDLLLFNSSNALVVLLDNGTEPFAAPVVTPTPYNIGTTASADVNADGRADVIILDRQTGSIGVMLGNGDGTFVAGTSFSTISSAGYLVVGDFNGDHHFDIAVGTYAPSQVAVYFGDNAGHFSGAVTTATSSSDILYAVADMNGDGKSDLFIRNAGNNQNIWLSNGDGTFTMKGNLSAGVVATGDFNHDGKADVAVSGSDTFLEIDFGNGDGTVALSARYVETYEANSIAVADLDGDGNLDILATGSDGTVTVFRSNANGTLNTPRYFYAGPYSSTLVVSDFDRDGKLDLIALTAGTLSTSPFLSFMRGNGDGTFDAYRAFHTGAVSSFSRVHSSAIVTADMNSDGKGDVIVIQQNPNTVLPYDLAVLMNDGSGNLAAPLLTSIGNTYPSFVAGDVNHDGKVDVVIPGLETLLGNGDGTFGAPITLTTTGSDKPILTDLDGDGNPDLLFPNSWQHGNGDGTFATPVVFTTLGTDVYLGDVNGDGALDFISSSTSYGSVPILFVNNGSGSFTQIVMTLPAPAAFADFNGDGKADVLCLTSTGTQVQLSNGDGTFGPPVLETMQPAPAGSVVTGDFDGDGKLDIASGTSINLGNGDGTFSSRSQLRTKSSNGSRVADVDGNGSPDLVYLTDGDDVVLVTTRTASDPTAQSSIALSSDKTTAQYGESVTFTATVTGEATPLTGVVRFTANEQILALVAVDADGKATFAAPFALGSFTISATYTGDEYSLGSTATTQINVIKMTTSVNLSASPNPQSGGRAFTVSGDLIPAFYALSKPTGVITLREGETVLGSFPATGGHVSIGSTLSVGSHLITADYAGDANFEASTTSYTQVITKPIPRLNIVVSPTGDLLPSTVITIHVDFINTTSPTGTITFLDSQTVIGTALLVNGAADLQTTLPWGQHWLQAQYSGDATWASLGGSQIWGITVYAGSFGIPLAIRAVGNTNETILAWTPIFGASKYTVWYRKTLIDGWQKFGDFVIQNVAYLDMPSNTTWEFAVTATDANGNVSAMSPPDLATTAVFTDPTIVPGVTPAKAQHITDLRTAVGSVRTFAGLGAFAYTTTPTAGQPILTTDILELRTALSQARNAIGLPVTFSDSTLTPGVTPIRVAHILELRAGVD